MRIKQFHDKGLAHLSYAVESDGEIVLIDPSRDIQPYIDYALKYKAKIAAVIETHPHADFVSSHFEFSSLDVTIFTSKLTGALYPHKTFDEGDVLNLGKVKLKALNTPGHSPDSISILLEDEQGKTHAVFTGDTLFIGDVGRPDLRENSTTKKEVLGKQLYHSLRYILMVLPDDTIVYPTHGPGSLCGKSMSKNLSGTIGQQKSENYALQNMKEEEFISIVLESQPFIPEYFSYDVELNRKGAIPLNQSIGNIKVLSSAKEIQKLNNVIIDTRPQHKYKQGHLLNSINIPNGLKFETWLGSIISPKENFYLIASDDKELDEVIYKSAKIGYESFIQGVLTQSDFTEVKENKLDIEDFSFNTSDYTIVDIRDHSEIIEGKLFDHSITIPLSELRSRMNEIPTNKPIAVHCAGGYRSAIGSSILSGSLKSKVYDLGSDVKIFTS